MSNSSELDYEKKFQDDLAKATALSLEQQVLDDIRRTRKYGTSSSVSEVYNPETPTRFMKELRGRSQRKTSTEFHSIRSEASATSAIQRRHSESNHRLANSLQYSSSCSQERLKTPPPDKVEADLISFSSPHSSNLNSSFDDLINDVQRNSTISNPAVIVPAGTSSTSTTSVYPNYVRNSSAAAAVATTLYTPAAKPYTTGPAGWQIVPFTSTQHQQKKPLTNDELQKLYKMPHIQPTNFAGTTGFAASSGFVAPAGYGALYNMNYIPQHAITAPTLPAPANAYGLQFGNYPINKNSLPTASGASSSYLNTITPSYNAFTQQPAKPQAPNNIILSTEPIESGSGSGSKSSTVNDSLTDASSNTIRRQMGPARSNQLGNDLIDLTETDDSRVSVLEAFDPLLNEHKDTDVDQLSDTESYYPEYDPFDFLYSGGSSHNSDPVYEAVNKSTTATVPTIGWRSDLLPDLLIYSKEKPQRPEKPKKCTDTTTPPPPLPPRISSRLPHESFDELISPKAISLDRRKPTARLYELITEKRPADPELLKFYDMVKELRVQYTYDDEITNKGHITSAQLKYHYPVDTSIKVLVHPAVNALFASAKAASKGTISGFGAPVVFTCDIETTSEMVLNHAFCSLEGQIKGNVNEYALKPLGLSEWLSPSAKLSELERVHNSLKLEKDVHLGLCLKTEQNMRVIARTEKDDLRDAQMLPEHILPNEMVCTVKYDEMMILIETLESEIAKLESSITEYKPVISCSGVIQAVKAICTLLGSIDTLEISAAVVDLKRVCDENSVRIPDAINDVSVADIRPIDQRMVIEQIKTKCNWLRDAVLELIELYSHLFCVGFSVKINEYNLVPLEIANVNKPFMVNINCLHRYSIDWNFDDYLLSAHISYGTRFISEPLVSRSIADPNGSFFRRLNFSKWLTFDKNPICILPKEARMVFILYGIKLAVNEPTADNPNVERQPVTTELSWCAIQLFDYKSEMACGSYLLSMWPPTADKFLGPAPARGCHPQPSQCPVLSIEVPSYGGIIQFPQSVDYPTPAQRYDFDSLDDNLRLQLFETIEQGYPGASDKREVFWEKRFYLQTFPNALAKVLHAAHSWDCASLMDLHSLLYSWAPLSPLQAFELLLPRYPDEKVRQKAVEWIAKLPHDQLVDYLPQLLQALKHDTYEASSMSRFLLSRSLESPRIAHHMYWLLCNSLPGNDPQNSFDDLMRSPDIDDTLIKQARYYRRNKMMLRALLAICGEKLLARFLRQSMMCQNLAKVAEEVKKSKESLRQNTLFYEIETVHQELTEKPTSLPLGPELEVTGVEVRSCSYFNSNTLPLKVTYRVPDGPILPAIFKSGDDLQQDMLTIQMIRVMNKWWLAEGLDLKMVTFNCVPTGYKRGMIEMVDDAETLRKIQIEYGLTGSFKDRPIAEWLAKQNESQLEYQRAVKNFTDSCAGYSVATYILGICDRHNDNIMLKRSGHLFHIDFGKFLGDAQMFGNFKRDRTPFVLTSDMMFVINGGEKCSTGFHYFVDSCCRGFNIIRKHADLILNLLALMATAGIPGVTADAVTYVRRALLPNQSNPEAAASFAKMIHSSLNNWFTQVNFFLHNLSQKRFSNDEDNGKLLSFVTRNYTMKEDDRLKSVMVVRFQKRYDMEKYYTYILRVTRHNQPDPTYLFRSFKEFTEFHQKLCLHFPLAKLDSLTSGIHVGRSNVKSVAEKRLVEIRTFLRSLFNSSDEIAHSDLVYTFFHPLLRDQQEANIEMPKVKELKTLPCGDSYQEEGQLKLSLQYRRCALTVMIHHAKGLPKLQGGNEPNTYVKCYLQPDSTKVTKRKTKVVRKSCVPSFMETLEYRMPLQNIQNRILHVTVWSHDSLQENELLGGFTIDLSEHDLRKELIDWFHLGPISRNFLRN